MDLKLDSDQISKALDTAILNALDTQTKQALVEQVVKYLTNPSEGYGKKVSPLYEALQAAARSHATKYFREKIESDPAYTTVLDSLYTEAFKKFTNSENREKLTDRMAARLSEAFDEKY